eukprot:m.193466 g.193466  ORF g.193466 m.193466 type:complete len:449 (+) comp15185_c0_seq1:204-1550(+)
MPGQTSPAELRAELAAARRRVAELEAALGDEAEPGSSGPTTVEPPSVAPSTAPGKTPSGSMSVSEVMRYGRQMILPAMGREGQDKLRAASVLIVGAGGLGCPTSLYLAAGGVGRLTIVDDDEVELGNLHRQVLHLTESVGQSKAESAAQRIAGVNPEVLVTPIRARLGPGNAEKLVRGHDVVVDCSDNMTTRYILNDVAVLLGLPMVAASALKCEGQLSTYDTRSGGPCYRCVFPQPLKPSGQRSCSESGVLGVIPGILGCLEALEVFKVIVGPSLGTPLCGRLLLFEGATTSCHTVRLGPRKPDCVVCGTAPSITDVAAVAYDEFCGAAVCATPTLLSPGERLNCGEFAAAREDENAVVLDVRPAVQFGIAHLPRTINTPFDTLTADSITGPNFEGKRIIVVCRRGNDSQIAVQKLRQWGGPALDVVDLRVRGAFVLSCPALAEFPS